MSKIEIRNDDLSVESAVIMDEVFYMLKDNCSDKNFSADKVSSIVPDTKGVVLSTILITIGTAVAGDMITFCLQEAIKKIFGRRGLLEVSIEKKQNEIRVKTEGNITGLNISVRITDDESENREN